MKMRFSPTAAAGMLLASEYDAIQCYQVMRTKPYANYQ